MTAADVLTDRELLGEYARCGSGEIFAQIVVRYVDLVHSAALRQVHDSHLADDVTQAVFLILSQRAGNLRPDTPLAGWFLLTTRNVARNALKREWRLKRRERRAAEMVHENDISSLPLEAQTIAPLLDDALARLSEIDRNAILQRFFYSKSHRQVGEALGLSEEAATKRVARAVMKLRQLLERSGVTVADGALMSALPLIAGKSASPALVSAIVSGLSSPGVAALAKTGAAISFKGGLIAAISTAVVVTVITVATVAVLEPAKPQAAAPATAPATAPAIAPAPVGQRTITIVAIDPQTDSAVAAADVQVQVSSAGNQTISGKTDATGKYVIRVPDNFNSITARIHAAGRVPMRISWQNYTLRGGVPPIYMVPMEKGTTIGGLVSDAAGNPLIGAKVTLYFGHGEEGESPVPDLGRTPLVTDADGRWKWDEAPSKFDYVYVNVTHSDYPGVDAGANPKSAELHAQSSIVTLAQSGKTASGVVLDSDGKPVAGATVTSANDRYESNKPTAKTDAQGKFELTGISKYQNVITITAAGFAPEQKTFGESADRKNIEFRLSKGVKLEGIVIAPDGQPIRNANIDVETWRNNRALVWKTKTDAQGHFVWNEAPADEIIFNVNAKNRMYMQYKMKAGETAEKITLYPPVTISGAVIDAETKQPIPQFKMDYGIKWIGQEDVTWQSQGGRTLTDGKYDATLNNISNGGRLRVEADGYLPATSRLINGDEGKITLDFELKKGKGPSGVVVDTEGKPVFDVVVYCVPDDSYFYYNDDNGSNNNREIAKSRTSKSGEFSFRPQDKSFKLVVFADQGNALVSGDELSKSSPPQIKLSPWGRIEGDARKNIKPAAGVQIAVQTNFSAGQQMSTIQRTVTTDARGHFVAERVLPGKVVLNELVPKGRMTYYHNLGNYEVESGKSLSVQAGGVGRPVVAMLVIPPQVKAKLNDNYPLNANAQLKAAKNVSWFKRMPYPENFPDMTEKEQQKWYEEFNKSPQGQAIMKEAQDQQNQPLNFQFVLSEDGKLNADDVKPGTYDLDVTAYGEYDQINRRQDLLARTHMEFTVPEIPKCPTDEVLDLGKIELKSAASFNVGDQMPALKLATPDGQSIKLEDMRGKVVLLHVWMMHQTDLTPAIQQTYQKHKDDSHFAVVELGINMLPAWVTRLGKKLDMPGTLAVSAESLEGGYDMSIFSGLGINQAPAVFLIDPQGKLIARDLKADQIEPAVAKALGK